MASNSVGGIATRTRGERAYDEREAATIRAEIAAGEKCFKEFVKGWAAHHAGDETMIAAYLDDFLADYFFERRRAADMIEEGEL